MNLNKNPTGALLLDEMDLTIFNLFKDPTSQLNKWKEKPEKN
jgi:hypothetical protein